MLKYPLPALIRGSWPYFVTGVMEMLSLFVFAKRISCVYYQLRITVCPCSCKIQTVMLPPVDVTSWVGCRLDNLKSHKSILQASLRGFQQGADT